MRSMKQLARVRHHKEYQQRGFFGAVNKARAGNSTRLDHAVADPIQLSLLAHLKFYTFGLIKWQGLVLKQKRVTAKMLRPRHFANRTEHGAATDLEQVSMIQ